MDQGLIAVSDSQCNSVCARCICSCRTVCVSLNSCYAYTFCTLTLDNKSSFCKPIAGQHRNCCHVRFGRWKQPLCGACVSQWKHLQLQHFSWTGSQILDHLCHSSDLNILVWAGDNNSVCEMLFLAGEQMSKRKQNLFVQPSDMLSSGNCCACRELKWPELIGKNTLTTLLSVHSKETYQLSSHDFISFKHIILFLRDLSLRLGTLHRLQSSNPSPVWLFLLSTDRV